MGTFPEPVNHQPELIAGLIAAQLACEGVRHACAALVVRPRRWLERLVAEHHLRVDPQPVLLRRARRPASLPAAAPRSSANGRPLYIAFWQPSGLAQGGTCQQGGSPAQPHARPRLPGCVRLADVAVQQGVPVALQAFKLQAPEEDRLSRLRAPDIHVHDDGLLFSTPRGHEAWHGVVLRGA